MVGASLSKFITAWSLVSLVYVAKSQPEQCSAEYKCGFSILDPQVGNKAFHFDFSSLCKDGDYTIDDGQGHTYYANICKEASQMCLPADCAKNEGYCIPWKNTYVYGNAVQMWGTQPPKVPKNPDLKCQLPYSEKDTPCTKACEVLGVGSPSWSLSNPSDPGNSDVIGTWTGVPPSDEDPFPCAQDPATGLALPRQVHMNFECSPDVDTAELYKASSNTSNTCEYTLYFKTKQACTSSTEGMSAGSAFLLLLFVGALVYFLGGGLFNYLAHGKFQILHKAFWQGLPALVMDGVHFLKDKVTGRTQTFNSVPATDAGASYDSGSAAYKSYEEQEMGGTDQTAAAAYADL